MWHIESAKGNEPVCIIVNNDNPSLRISVHADSPEHAQELGETIIESIRPLEKSEFPPGLNETAF